jgi:pimeloyl-ACP methyl ester carboxylesterase
MKLVFLHGSGGKKNSWYHQSEYFRDADTPMLPGHPEGQLLPTVEEHVAWLRGYLQDKGYGDIVLAGHSLGGAIALMYALAHPDEVKALIVMSGGAKLRVHPKILAHFERAVDDREGWAKSQEALYAKVDPQMKAELLAEAVRMGPEVQLNDFRCVDKFDIMDRLHEIRLPVLVMCGSEDQQTPEKYTRYLGDNIEGARAVIIEGGGHLAAVEKPQEVTQAIEAFLQSI